MDQPTRIGVPNARALGPAIRKVAARCQPAAVRAYGGKTDIILRTKLKASLLAVPVNQSRKATVGHRQDPAVSAGAGPNREGRPRLRAHFLGRPDAQHFGAGGV